MRESIWDRNGGIYFGKRYAPQEPPKDKSLLDVEGRVTEDLHRYASRVEPNGDLTEADRHVFTLGPNGSGKTRRLLVPNLAMLTSWSIVVVDPKGTLAVQTAAHRMAAGSEIITLDPFGVIERQYPGLVENLKDRNGRQVLKSAGLNPLSALDPGAADDEASGEDFPDDAKAIGQALIKVDARDSQPHFAQSAQSLASGAIMGLRVKLGPEANLQMLRALLGSPPQDFSKYIADVLLDGLPSKYTAIKSKLGRFKQFDGDNREVLGMISTAITQTDWLDSPLIQRDLEGDSRAVAAKLADMKKTATTVYLILPPRYLETHATWLRLMLTTILTPLLRSTGAERPVLFMLDEFAQLGRLEVIERNMALMREYGVKLWPIFQDLTQAKDVYQGRWESFVGNAGVLQAFAPQDDTTRDYLSRISGQRLYWLDTTSSNTGQSMGPQSSTSTGMTQGQTHIAGPVYWPQGLGRMRSGQAILFAKGFSPRSWLPDPASQEMPLTRKMLADADAAAARGRAVRKQI